MYKNIILIRLIFTAFSQSIVNSVIFAQEINKHNINLNWTFYLNETLMALNKKPLFQGAFLIL